MIDLLKRWFLYLCVLLVNSFCTQGETTLNKDPDVLSVFNEKEISSLIEIIYFYDNHVLKKEKEVSKAYFNYFDSISDLEVFENIIISKSGNWSKAELLLEELKLNGVFNEIWKYDYEYDSKFTDTLYIRLSYNLQGKYFELLKLKGNKYAYIFDYVNSIENCHCIPPSSITNFLKNNYKKTNFRKESNRLIWAIHYITVLYKKDYSQVQME